MLNFKAVALEDRAVLEPVLRAQPYRICDHCFACLYIWENTYPAQFCFDEDILYLRTVRGDDAGRRDVRQRMRSCSASRLCGGMR